MKFNSSLLRASTIAALTASVVGTASILPTQASAEVNFAGKTVTMIVGNRPGGGTDAVGRLMGEFLVKHLPGKPKIVVRNMPGGGGITALNYFANQVKPDGLTIVTGASTQTDPGRWRQRTSKYDPTKFPMIGGIMRGATVLMIGKDAKARLLDKSKKPVVVGAIDGTRSGIVMSMWGGEFLGWNIKWVVGYPGTSELILALQRGEIDMTSTGNAFHIRELLKGGKHTPQAQSGTLADGKLVARAEFPNVPLFPQQVRPKLKSAISKEAFNYWEGINALDKWLGLPPGTPSEIVAAYEKAFTAATRDKEFLARARKGISEDIVAISGKDQAALVRQIGATTKEAFAYIDDIKKKQGLPIAKKKKKKNVKQITVATTLDSVKRGGRELYFKAKGGKTHKVKVSSSKTDVFIKGNMESRAKLKPGMSCEISYPGNGKTAKAVKCK